MKRLKTRPQFQAALAGKTVARTQHFALHSCALDQPQPLHSSAILFPAIDVWLGAMVPKRWAKRAVTRNAIKRQIYTVSAHFEAALPQRAHVVRLRSGFDRHQFVSAKSDVLRAVVRAELYALFGAEQAKPIA